MSLREVNVGQAGSLSHQQSKGSRQRSLRPASRGTRNDNVSSPITEGLLLSCSNRGHEARTESDRLMGWPLQACDRFLDVELRSKVMST
jgi:hypothetical protein